MESTTSDIYHIVRQPRTRAVGPSPAIILLHGRGADENDLIGLSSHLDERLMIFSVRAPYPFEFGGYTYFQLSDEGKADPTMFGESYRRLMKFVDDVGSMPEVDPGRIYLLGFSMGTIMAYALSLTRPERFAGVIAQSGFVRTHTDLVFQWKNLQGCPFIITHGVADPIIPVRLARETKEMFGRSNAECDYREYRMGHEISEESLADVCGWLKKRLG